MYQRERSQLDGRGGAQQLEVKQMRGDVLGMGALMYTALAHPLKARHANQNA